MAGAVRITYYCTGTTRASLRSRTAKRQSVRSFDWQESRRRQSDIGVSAVNDH